MTISYKLWRGVRHEIDILHSSIERLIFCRWSWHLRNQGLFPQKRWSKIATIRKHVLLRLVHHNPSPSHYYKSVLSLPTETTRSEHLPPLPTQSQPVPLGLKESSTGVKQVSNIFLSSKYYLLWKTICLSQCVPTSLPPPTHACIKANTHTCTCTRRGEGYKEKAIIQGKKK